MRSLEIYQVDAFTSERFKGNPAGVVLNADGLSDEDMLCIARELNNSETAFILSPDGPDHEVRIRYFTPKAEVPICGHATIAAHYVRAIVRGLGSTTVIHKIGIGILPVEIIKHDDEYSVIMTQSKVVFSEPFRDIDKEQIIKALGLSKNELDIRCPLQTVSTGNSKVMIGVKSRDVLNSLIPDTQALIQISKGINCNGYFVFTLDSQLEGVLTHGRMFAPAIGISEDPVTGNAHAPLGPYLIKHGLVKPSGDMFTFKGEQGYSLGRSGIVDVFVSLNEGEVEEVRIGGDAVIVFKASIEI